MAVNYLIFDGVKSSDYGIYISGEALFSAPKRDAEMISIPGRNGSFLLDNNRYENIQVTYPAFCYSSTYSGFISSIANFRNAIASKVGYKRLTDTFHTTEYRMGAFLEGLEVDAIKYNSGATFDIVFECKPQRFLTSGESAVTVANNGTITNPTLYDASPLLEVEGYGNIAFNGYSIDIENATLGYAVLVNSGSATGSTWSTVLSSNYFNTGNTITIGASNPTLNVTEKDVIISHASPTVTNGTMTWTGSKTALCSVTLPVFSITAGTDATDTVQYTSTYSCSIYGGVPITETITIDITRSYIAATNTVQYSGSVNIANNTATSSGWTMNYGKIAVEDSTVSILGTPTYIDCDLGEAYKIENNEMIDLNAYIDLGSDLPKLSPGSNAVTYDNTITDFKIVPNWWQL